MKTSISVSIAEMQLLFAALLLVLLQLMLLLASVVASLPSSLEAPTLAGGAERNRLGLPLLPLQDSRRLLGLASIEASLALVRCSTSKPWPPPTLLPELPHGHGNNSIRKSMSATQRRFLLLPAASSPSTQPVTEPVAAEAVHRNGGVESEERTPDARVLLAPLH